jgi:putative acetyltransferase
MRYRIFDQALRTAEGRDMTAEPEIRETTPGDTSALERLYRATFPDEDLVALVRELVGGAGDVLTLAAVTDGTIAGHVAFTRCTIGESGTRAALLAPLAVAPDRQRQGLGRALVAAGFDHLSEESILYVFVLGDPACYSRLGFTREDAVMPPYALPPDWDGAWQSTGLRGAASPPPGSLDLPPVWLRPELWLP